MEIAYPPIGSRPRCLQQPGLGQSEGRHIRTQSISPMGVVGTPALGHHLLLSRVCNGRKLDQKVQLEFVWYHLDSVICGPGIPNRDKQLSHPNSLVYFPREKNIELKLKALCWSCYLLPVFCRWAHDICSTLTNLICHFSSLFIHHPCSFSHWPSYACTRQTFPHKYET